MTIAETVDKVIGLPFEFHNRGDVSARELLRQSAYFERHEEVTEDAIRESLSQHPECIDAWIQFSEDKRTDRGWYIKQECEDRYVVGYYPASTDRVARSCRDRAKACAAYIKREIEDIRSR